MPLAPGDFLSRSSFIAFTISGSVGIEVVSWTYIWFHTFPQIF
jgi:hypothetical protein